MERPLKAVSKIRLWPNGCVVPRIEMLSENSDLK
jgi:hypothetical protein